MDVVLGLALTSTAVRWVLAEGATGEGAPIDRGQFQVDGLDADFLLDLLLNQDVVAESQLHAVGVTWTNDAAVAAGAVLDALAERGLRNVVAVSDNDAAAALATGVADITGHDDVAVCVIEPDNALVTLVTTDAVTVDRIERPLDRSDALELTSSVIALLDVDDRRPEAIFVVGSDDIDVDMIVSSFEAISEAPVFSATEAELALARGAALASARDVNVDVAEAEADGALPGPSLVSRTRMLSVVLGAAVLTFVVSLSLALYVNLPQGEQPLNSNAAEEAPSPRPAAPAGGRARPAVPEVAKTIVVRAPQPAAAPKPEPPAAAPDAAPPPAYQPPAPAYVPPAPAYVPPPAAPVSPPPVYQQPRLRDRIIERIPIINRFHEPQYPG
jgi:hypothetical protein